MVTPVTVPTAVLQHAGGVARDIAAELGIDIDVQELLGGRAAMLGLTAGGQVSAGGATRLLPGRDGWCALTLSRPDDIDAVPALVERDGIGADPWPAVRHGVRRLGVSAFAERARLLGLPVGVLGETRPSPIRLRRIGDRRARPATADLLVADLLVADLSSMWAGPLCGALLARAGATVVKVETATRPDGTRSGPTAFFDWMNGDKLSYRVDFEAPEGLRRLLRVADVVIESSRPGALERHGVGVADFGPRHGGVWIRITGHGTEGERGAWVAFGDDAAVSGGLVGGRESSPQFCGDALADPLTGLHATDAVLRSLARGGGELADLSMAAVAAHYAGVPRDAETPCTVVPQRMTTASELGADTGRVEALVAGRLAARC